MAKKKHWVKYEVKRAFLTDKMGFRPFASLIGYLSKTEVWSRENVPSKASNPKPSKKAL